MKLKEVKLGDVATYVNGYAFKPEHWGTSGLPIIRIQNLTNSSNVVNYFSGEYDERYIVTTGDILISWSASLGIYEWQGNNALLNQHIFKVVFDKGEINKKFFKYVTGNAIKEMKKYVHGSTMKHITKKYFDDIRIYLPSVQIQKKISAVLDKAQDLIDKRKEQIEAVDEFIKSVFLDMFGDTFNNNKKWHIIKFNKVIDKIDSGWSPKCEDYASGDNTWGVLKLSAVTGGTYKYTENKALPISLEPIQHIEVQAGDLLFTRKNTRELVGACAYVFKTQPKLMLSDTIFRFVTKDNINKIYLWCLFSNNYFKKEIQNLASGSAGSMPNISKAKLMALSIPLPDLELQNKFAQIVQKTEQQKELLQKSLTELENNFNSLMQRAFKGELFN